MSGGAECHTVIFGGGKLSIEMSGKMFVGYPVKYVK